MPEDLTPTPAATPSETPPAAAASPPQNESVVGSAPAPFDFASLTLPEGIALSEEQKAQLGPVLTGVPSEKVQALLDFHSATLRQADESLRQHWEQQNQQWVNEIKADPVYGGDKLDATLQSISKAIQQFSPDPEAFKAALNMTGAGNHPAVVRTFAAIASKLVEGQHIQGSPPATAKRPSFAAALYPNLPEG